MAIAAAVERFAVVSPALHREPSVLVFDSGLGGLSVFREVARARPDARFSYVADDAGFPYGALSDQELIRRVGEVVGTLVHRLHPDLVVIACNTASTLALPSLRAHHAIPFVGTVPAVKPACAASVSRKVSILATPGTVRRDYTAGLIREFASGCDVTLVPSVRLAGLVEAVLAGDAVSDGAILDEIGPCFVADAASRTDTVVLACTHYPLILDRLEALSPWPVAFVDPAPAIARRVTSLLGPDLEPSAPLATMTPVRLFSTRAALDAALISALIGRPVETPEVLDTAPAAL